MIETVLKRDRFIMLAGLTGIAALAWLYIIYLAWDMNRMPMEMAMPQMQNWHVPQFLLTFVMWAVMMVAMMVPSATPMILTYATMQRRRQENQQPFVPTSMFLLGYLVVWIAFSVLATFVQWGLHATALLSPMMMSTSAILGSALLVTAGAFQFTPLKQVCLRHCRTPFSFFLNEWQDGSWGAFAMGGKHGSFCLGCCWFLMVLLFVAGVMNLLWVATLSILVLLEKVMPTGEQISKVAGVGLIIWGVWLASSMLM